MISTQRLVAEMQGKVGVNVSGSTALWFKSMAWSQIVWAIILPSLVTLDMSVLLDLATNTESPMQP